MTKKPSVGDYDLLDEIEHIRRRPGMYAGSVDPSTFSEWVYQNQKMVKKEITYIPALVKIASEIIDNI